MSQQAFAFSLGGDIGVMGGGMGMGMGLIDHAVAEAVDWIKVYNLEFLFLINELILSLDVINGAIVIILNKYEVRVVKL